MAERANPFGGLEDFQPRATPAKRPDPNKVSALATTHGFPSREGTKAPAVEEPVRRQKRRFRTGRNQQINIKATAETIDRFINLAEVRNLPLGALLELACDALENK